MATAGGVIVLGNGGDLHEGVGQADFKTKLDRVVLCLFEAMTPSLVKSESESAGMPCERVMETVWIGPKLDDQPEGSKR
jgi:hypothetical protein